MKIRMLYVLLSVLLLLSLLSGCGGTPAESTPAGDNLTSTDDTLPAPVSGTYEGQAVTLRYRTVTDLKIYAIDSFAQGVAVLRAADHFLLADSEGKQIGKNTYALIYSFGEDGRALAQTAEEQWIYINTKGEMVGEADAPAVNETATVVYDSSETTGAKSATGDYLRGIKSADGKYLTQPIFEWISGTGDDLNYAILAQGEHRQVMINPQGEVKVTLPDDSLSAYAMSEHIVCGVGDIADRRYRLLDSTGKVLSDNTYTSISEFVNGFAAVTDGNKLGLIAADGTAVIPPSLPIDEPLDYVPQMWGDRIACIRDGKLAIVEIRVAQADKVYTFRPGSDQPAYTCAVTVTEDTTYGGVAISLGIQDAAGNQVQTIQAPTPLLGGNEVFTKEPVYFRDITFDGCPDLLVPCMRPAYGCYFYTYAWDAEAKQFVLVPEAATLCNIALDTENHWLLTSGASQGDTSYTMYTYDEEQNRFVSTHSLYYTVRDYNADEARPVHVIEKRNGSIIKDTFVPNGEAGIQEYTAAGSFWDIHSDKWDCILKDELTY